jgi:hypothetical protein
MAVQDMIAGQSRSLRVGAVAALCCCTCHGAWLALR